METQNEARAKEIAQSVSFFWTNEEDSEKSIIDTISLRKAIFNAALQAMQWKEQQIIDKLEDWLANNICNAYNFRGDDISATFMDDCLKAMKGE